MSENTNKDLWAEFDEEMDIAALQKDIDDAAENSGSYKDVPHGKYEVTVEKMDLTKSKTSGKKMVSIWFKVVGKGDPYQGNMIFMNQVVEEGFQINIVNELLRAMDTSVNVEFKSYSQYGNMLLDIHEEIYGKVEFALNYSKSKKGYDQFEIEEVFDVE